MADRYTYIPSLGLFLALAWGAAEAAARSKPRRLLLGLAAVVVLGGLSYQTARQVSCWKTDRTLFEHAIHVTDRNFLALTAVGDMLAREGKHNEALGYLSEAVKAAPTCSGSWLGLAVALEGMGKRQDALTNYQIALRLDPQNGEVHNGYGASLIEQGKLAEAETELREAHRLRPDDTLIWLNLAVALRQEGKIAEALRECEGVVQLDPTSERGQNMLAESLMQVGKADAAVEHYSEALRLNPKSADARVGLGLSLIEKGDFPGATAQFEALLKAEPKNPKALDGIGYALVMQGKLDQARTNFLEAQRLDPKYAQGYFHYAMCLTARNEAKEAIEQYRKALSLNSKLPLALNNLAWLLASDADPQVRNGKEAVELAEEACKLVNYEQPFYIGTLAAAYAEAGRFGDAISMGERARDLARSKGMEAVAQRNEELLKLYRTGQPYHEPGSNPDTSSSK